MRAQRHAVRPEDSLARARAIMDTLGTREVPVVDAGTLVGILVRSDLEPHHGHFEWTPVRAAMTPDPVTVAPDTAAAAAARMLIERAFNGLPVTVGSALVGMLRRSDLLRLLVDAS